MRMNVKLGVCMLVCLVVHAASTQAMIFYRPRPLSNSIKNAPVVAHVRIKEIHDRHFRDGGELVSCGRDYVVDVLTTFKGRPRSERTFSLVGQPHALFSHEVKPGDELLVLLTARRREESADNEPTDVITGPPSRAEIKCRAQLSLMTLWDGSGGGYPLIFQPRTSSSGHTHTAWLAYSTLRTALPESLLDEGVTYFENCPARECTQLERMVPWAPLEAEIRRWTNGAKLTPPSLPSSPRACPPSRACSPARPD